ncbi:MAG: membrane protein insertase YidC, partial [Pseudomonadota bacterium]
MDDQNRNLLLATALSFLVIMVWFVLFPPPEEPTTPVDAAQTAETAGGQPPVATPLEGGPDAALPNSGSETAEAVPEEAPRAAIETARVRGSISLQGGRIDDLTLQDYRETLDPEADVVHLFNPLGRAGAYYALYGWVPGGSLEFEDVPGADTAWTLTEGTELTSETPLTLAWNNGAGLLFERKIAIDEDFMFTVTQTVTNQTGAPVRLAPYGVLTRHGLPDDLKGFFILHEGAVGMADGELYDPTYNNISDFDVDPNWRT